MVQWWDGHNAVGFFLTAGFLGMMYYFVPKQVGKPIYSYRLSIVHFWALISIYMWAGPHHLHYTSLPDWAQSLGMVFSLILLAPSWGGMINGFMTMSGAWHKLSMGLAWSQDDIDPVGGAPVPLSQMLDVGDLSNKRSTDSKDVLDLLLGVTQVLSRNTVLRLNYAYSQSSGYLNDPYKILSIVDPLTGDTIARTPAPGALGPTGLYIYESRPDSRAKHSLYAEMKHAFGAPVVHAAYRFMTDDWGIDSHTGELRLRWPIGAASYLEPQLRYYMQSEADFYQASLVQGQPLPSYASADFRLGDFDAVTVGIKFGQRTSGGNEWSTRLEYYQQSGDVPREQLIGRQLGREQYPDLSALIVQFSYRFGL